MKVSTWLAGLLALGEMSLGNFGTQWSQAAPLLPASCPDTAQGETAEDCPWAGVARELTATLSTGKPLLPVLKTKLPGLHAKIRQDAKTKSWASLWGKSINYDEYAKGIVVQPELIRSFQELFKVGPYSSWIDSIPSDRIVHAGIEHTYGYLFSTLKTPFGFKRARWVKPTLDTGFGLPENTLTPLPRHGTLLSNVTYFIGRIAFRNEPDRLKTLEIPRKEVSPALLKFPYSSLEITRLEEIVSVPIPGQKDKARTVRISTDFVPFKKNAPGETNSHLLVYSVDDPEEGGHKLITAFPVQKSFMETALKAENLGENKPVMTRYNGYVDGLSGKPLQGRREVKAVSKQDST